MDTKILMCNPLIVVAGAALDTWVTRSPAIDCGSELMLFTYSLCAALVLCCIGLLWRFWQWLSEPVGLDGRAHGPLSRLSHVIGGVAGLLFSVRIFKFIWAGILDGLFQRRLLRTGFSRWLGHMLIFMGFVLLLVFHAMQAIVSENLFDNYYPTLNPFLFLRDFCGVMIIIGVAMAVYRRYAERGMRRTNRAVDMVALVAVALIVVSGFGLWSVKIASYKVFDRMIEDYGDSDEPGEVKALRLVWAADYGVVFPKAEAPPYSEELMATGRALNEDSCIYCHARPQWSFASYGLAKAVSPAAVMLADVGAENFLWVLHYMACFVGLALLPWTKFLHIFTSPLVAAINCANKDRRDMNPASRAFLRALEIDACTHCALCSIHCSVSTAMGELGILDVLPSEKLHSLARMSRGVKMDARSLNLLRQGADICTSCHRCTDLCPVGIDLHDLWAAQLEDLDAAGMEDTYRSAARRTSEAAEPSRHAEVLRIKSGADIPGMDLSARAQTFSDCYGCMTCTTVCPVVQQCGEPKAVLDLTPHQVMHALAMGLREEALGARMIWYCLSCYRCQEACPQGVRVTDVFIELTNLAAGANRNGEKS